MKLFELAKELVIKKRTLVLYFFIGASAALVDLSVFFIFFNFIEHSSVVATTVSVIIATIYAFLLNAYFNFRTTDHLLARFFSYAMVSGVGLLISILLLQLFNVMLGFNGNIIKIISLPIIFVVQYLLNKKVTFQRKENGINNISQPV